MLRAMWVAVAVGVAIAASTNAQEMRLVGRSDLGGTGLNGEVTVVVPAGVAAHGVSAAHLRTPAFTGDLLAVAMTMCGSAGNMLDRGVAYYDVTRASAPTLLGRYHADADIVLADSIPA